MSATRLSLKLLGDFEVRCAEGPVIGIGAKKTRALLAYLALAAGRAQGREKLADLFWSDRGDKQARDSLRQALAELRDALADIHPAPLITDHDLVLVDPAAVEVDALLFMKLAASDSADELRRAAALYEGDLLDGLGVRDPIFADWLRDERQRYRDLAVAVLKKLLAHDTGAPAAEIARRLLAQDPLQEEGHRALIRLHIEAGDIAAAQRQYDTCCTALKRELDVAPSPETEALQHRIKQRSETAKPATSLQAATSPVSALQFDASLSSRATIAVLPFANLSDDSEQRYLSDGITEDIITQLSRFREFIVISRHSSFRFRDSAGDVKHVGRELGVRYVVEGSVRRVGDSIRIIAELIDATDGAHLWAERHDRSASEIFSIQNEVVQAIVGTFATRLEHVARERAKRRPSHSLAAYECLLRAQDEAWRLYYDTEAYFREGLDEARRMCERAIEFDPRYARAYACLGTLHLGDWLYRGRSDDLDRAVTCARTAVSIDDADDWCHATLGVIYLKRAEHDRAEYHMQKAIELNPNDADTYCHMGLYFVYVGQPLLAIERLQSAMRRNPFCPDYYHETLGMAYYLANRYEEGVVSLRRIRKITSWGHAYLAACYAQLDRLEEAHAETAEYVREARTTGETPGPAHERRLRTLIAALDADLRTHKKTADYHLWLDGMRKAGLPI